MNNGTQKLVVIAIALACFASVATGPVVAQDGGIDSNISVGGNNSSLGNGSLGNGSVGNGTLANGTVGNNSSAGNGTAGNNSSAGGGGGNCGISNPQGCLPDFVNDPLGAIMDSIDEIIGGIIGAFVTLFSGALQWMMVRVVELINGIPAPGNIDDPLSWNPGLNGNGGGDPSTVSSDREVAGGLWNDIYQTWFFTLSLAGIILAISATWLFTTADPYKYREVGRKWLLALVMSVLTWFIAPLALHVTRALSLGIAPSAIELTTNLGDLGLGALLALVLVLFAFGVVLQAFVILMIQYFLAHFLVAAWPLLWSLRATNNDTLESVGNSGLYMFGLLCVLYVAQAIILRFTFSLDFLAANMSIGSRLFGFAASMVGLYLGLVLLPKRLLTRAMQAGAFGLGAKSLRGRGASLAGGTGIMGYGKGVKRGLNQRKEDYQNAKDRLTSDDEPSARNNREEDASPTGGAGGRTTGSGVAATDGGRGGSGVDSEARAGSRYGDMSMDETNDDDYDYKNNDESNYKDGRTRSGRFVGRTRDQSDVRNSRNGRRSPRRRSRDRPDSTSGYTAEALGSDDGGVDAGSRAGARGGSSGGSDSSSDDNGGN